MRCSCLKFELMRAAVGSEMVQSEVKTHSAELDRLTERMDKLQAGEVSVS